VSSFTNRTSYVLNIKALTTLFETKFTLFEVQPSGPNTIRARWTLALKPRLAAILPWEPKAVISGVADYEVDLVTGLITSHSDTWDALPDDTFLAGLAYVLRSFAQVLSLLDPRPLMLAPP
jgi:hypothetical protein